MCYTPLIAIFGFKGEIGISQWVLGQHSLHSEFCDNLDSYTGNSYLEETKRSSILRWEGIKDYVWVTLDQLDYFPRDYFLLVQIINNTTVHVNLFSLIFPFTPFLLYFPGRVSPSLGFPQILSYHPGKGLGPTHVSRLRQHPFICDVLPNSILMPWVNIDPLPGFA